MGVRLPQQGCRSWIWAKAQMHERRRSPIRPLCLVTGGPDEAPQPAHCDSRMGCIIIAGTGDDCNRHQSRYVAPLSPVVELQQIVRAHDPDEPPFGIAADQFLERIHGIARTQLPRSEEHTSELQSLMRISYAVLCFKK